MFAPEPSSVILTKSGALWTPRKFYTPADTDKPHRHRFSYKDHYALRLSDGDVLTVILLGGIYFRHENRRKGIQIWRSCEYLRKFSSESMNQCALQSCKSESLIDQIQTWGPRQNFIHTSAVAKQNSTDIKSPSGQYQSFNFGGAFVKSLSTAQGRQRIVEDHLNHVIWSENKKRKRRLPHGVTQRPSGILFLFQNSLMCCSNDLFDLSFTRASQKACRVITPLRSQSYLQNPTGAVISLTETLNAGKWIEEEISLDSDPPAFNDIYIVSEQLSMEYALKERRITLSESNMLVRWKNNLWHSYRGFERKEIFIWFSTDSWVRAYLI